MFAFNRPSRNQSYILYMNTYIDMYTYVAEYIHDREKYKLFMIMRGANYSCTCMIDVYIYVETLHACIYVVYKTYFSCV